MKNNFIKTPYLPEKKVQWVLVDYRVDDKTLNNLQLRGINIIKTLPCHDLYEAVEGHPDMVLHPLGGQDIIVAPNVFSYYKDKLEPLGFHIIEGKTLLTRNYPENIAYNICRVGNFLIHNFKYTDEILLNYYSRPSYIKIHVSQGYSKCSIAVINEEAIITADAGIHREVTKFGIDSLMIDEGNILLPGLNYGFIGGTCGYLDSNYLAFFGKIQDYKNYEKISKFAEKYGKSLIAINEKALQDYGTLIPLTEMD
ncbi:DUF6873 family GME fold protein [Natronincola ferrireducens]|nr:hypothetical protein [Natronincola ferrireducens]